MAKTKIVCAPMEPELDTRLAAMATSLGLTKSEIMRRSLRMFLASYAEDPQQAVVALMTVPREEKAL